MTESGMFLLLEMGHKAVGCLICQLRELCAKLKRAICAELEGRSEFDLQVALSLKGKELLKAVEPRLDVLALALRVMSPHAWMHVRILNRAMRLVRCNLLLCLGFFLAALSGPASEEPSKTSSAATAAVTATASAEAPGHR